MNFLLAATVAAAAFLQGETLDYNLTWLRITGGTARMTISPQGEENLRITSVAKSSAGFSRVFKVHDEIESVVARNDFSTVKYTKRLDEDGDQMLEVTTVADGTATRVRRKVKTVKVPRPVFDPISLIYHLRTVDLSPGQKHDFMLLADGKVYDVHARVTKREVVQTPAGKFNTVLVEPRWFHDGVERSQKMWIWYSDDSRHIPVRIRTEVNFGSITATLRGMGNTVTSTDPPVLKGK